MKHDTQNWNCGAEDSYKIISRNQVQIQHNPGKAKGSDQGTRYTFKFVWFVCIQELGIATRSSSCTRYSQAIDHPQEPDSTIIPRIRGCKKLLCLYENKRSLIFVMHLHIYSYVSLLLSSQSFIQLSFYPRYATVVLTVPTGREMKKSSFVRVVRLPGHLNNSPKFNIFKLFCAIFCLNKQTKKSKEI